MRAYRAPCTIPTSMGSVPNLESWEKVYVFHVIVKNKNAHLVSQ